MTRKVDTGKGVPEHVRRHWLRVHDGRLGTRQSFLIVHIFPPWRELLLQRAGESHYKKRKCLAEMMAKMGFTHQSLAWPVHGKC